MQKYNIITHATAGSPIHPAVSILIKLFYKEHSIKAYEEEQLREKERIGKQDKIDGLYDKIIEKLRSLKTQLGALVD